MNKHKDCTHYGNHWCNLKNKQVDPEGEACPDFEAK